MTDSNMPQERGVRQGRGFHTSVDAKVLANALAAGHGIDEHRLQFAISVFNGKCAGPNHLVAVIGDVETDFGGEQRVDAEIVVRFRRKRLYKA